MTIDWALIGQRAANGDVAATAAMDLECKVERLAATVLALERRMAALERQQGKRLDGGDEWRRLYEA